jgi:branched-chain amino acid transport system substrate-binding protein
MMKRKTTGRTSAGFTATRRSLLQAGAGAAAGLAVGMPFTAARAVGKGPIKIGCLNIYTKAGGVFGQAIYNNLQLYLDQRGGKIAGRDVQLIKENDEFNPRVALQKARKLVESDKVQIIAGPLGSHIAKALSGYLKQTGTPWIVTGAGATELTASHLSHMFRATLSNWQVASVMGTWAGEHLKKEAAYIGSDYLAGHDIAKAFRDEFAKKGGKVIKEIFTPVGTNDFSAYISQIGGLAPPMIYVFYSGQDAVRFIQQFDKFGMKGKMQLVTFQSVLDSETFPAQGDAAIGGISSSIYCETLDTPENKAYLALFRKKYNRYPGVFDESGYTAMHIIDNAAKAVNGNVEDRDAFCAAIAKTNIVAPRGPIRFDQVTHQAIQNVYVRKVVSQDGAPRNKVIDTFKAVGDYPPNRA